MPYDKDGKYYRKAVVPPKDATSANKGLKEANTKFNFLAILIFVGFIGGCVAILNPPKPRVCNKGDYEVIGKMEHGSGSATKFLLVNTGASNEEIRNVASKACGSRWCRLLIWDDRNFVETSFPLSEVSAAYQIAIYINNPATKSERLIIGGEEVPMGVCSNK